jgi:hypothetical protein
MSMAAFRMSSAAWANKKQRRKRPASAGKGLTIWGGQNTARAVTMWFVRCNKNALPQHREPLALTIKPSRLLVSILTDTVPAQSFCAEISLSFLSCFVGWRCLFAPSIKVALLPLGGADLRFTKETNDF